MAGIVPDPRQKTGNASPCEGSRDRADIGRGSRTGEGSETSSPSSEAEGGFKP